MKISIMGLGWFGEPLAKELPEHKVSGTTTTQEKIGRLSQSGIDVELCRYPEKPTPKILNSDIVILNIPPFPEALEWFSSWEWQKKTWVIFISSTSVLSLESKNSHLLKKQEEWIQSSFSSWTILRFGGLYSEDRHPGKSLSGKKHLSGRLWPVNLLHLHDAIQVTKSIIEQNVKGKIFEVVSDDHPTREDFYTDYCKKNGLPLPEFNQEDQSTKPAIENKEIKKIYSNFRHF